MCSGRAVPVSHGGHNDISCAAVRFQKRYLAKVIGLGRKVRYEYPE